VDIGKYNVDQYKRLLGDLAKYEKFVQSFSDTKMVEGNKVPKRVYQIVILEPDAVDLNAVKNAKDKVIQEHIRDGEQKELDKLDKVVETVNPKPPKQDQSTNIEKTIPNLKGKKNG